MHCTLLSSGKHVSPAVPNICMFKELSLSSAQGLMQPLYRPEVLLPHNMQLVTGPVPVVRMVTGAGF